MLSSFRLYGIHFDLDPIPITGIGGSSGNDLTLLQDYHSSSKLQVPVLALIDRDEIPGLCFFKAQVIDRSINGLEHISFRKEA